MSKISLVLIPILYPWSERWFSNLETFSQAYLGLNTVNQIFSNIFYQSLPRTQYIQKDDNAKIFILGNHMLWLDSIWFISYDY